MAIDIYLRVDNITGESKDKNHKGWTHVQNFKWGAEQPGSMDAGGGGGAGKVSMDDLTVVAPIDKIAPVLLLRCASGKHIPKVELSVCKAGGEQIEYSRITLEDVIVTSVEFIGAQDADKLLVEYRFQGAKYQDQYWEQTEQGTRGAEISSKGNLKENTFA